MSNDPECRRQEYDSSIKFEEPDQCYSAAKNLADGDHFVVEAWAYALKGHADGLHAVVANGHGGLGFILGQSGDSWVVLVGGVGFTTLARVQPETWIHLAVVKSDGVVSGWVNGQKVCGLPNLGGGVQNFSIGATAPGRESFQGWVAEVRYSTFKPGQFDTAADFLLVFTLRLGSRRQIDFDLRDLELCLLDNLNRLAATEQTRLPVTNTVDHFLEHTEGVGPFARLRQRCAHRLIRMRALDPFRLQGRLVLALDGTGMLTFHQRHCPHCLTQKHGDTTVYFHPVLEAKIITDTGLAISLETEFIENTPQDPATDYDQARKQDCELKAFARLADRFQAAFPQLALTWSADSLYACGPFFARCRQARWSFVVTFKEGRLPDLWREFQALLRLVPHQCLREALR